MELSRKIVNEMKSLQTSLAQIEYLGFYESVTRECYERALRDDCRGFEEHKN